MKKMILLTSAIAILAGCGNVPNTQNEVKFETTTVQSTKVPASFESEIKAKMQAHNLKGFSLAIFEDYKLVYSNQWGVKAATSGALVDEETAFSTASISKPVTALICVMLAEKGLINLDDPISKYLTRWSLPNSEFTKDTPVTWKHLLSHMAGTTQHGFADFYEGYDIPTLAESLQGKLPRYNNEQINFTFKPGTDWKYSGGGYTTIQMALEDHIGKPLHILAQENIFAPLGMENTTMVQPNETGFLTNVASVHNREGDVIHSGLPITPQVAPSGMWSTPEDLAKLGIAMQMALRGDKDTIISPQTAKTVTDIISLKSSGGSTLGWFRAFGFGNIDWMRYDGSNTGVGGDFLASMEGGKGFVFFANGDRPNRFPVTSYVRGETIRMMEWEKPFNTNIQVPDLLLQAIEGSYKDFLYGQNMDTEIVSLDGKIYLDSPLFAHFIGKNLSEMIYVGDNTFKIMDYPNLIRFNLGAKNQVKNLTILRNGNDDLSIDVEIER